MLHMMSKRCTVTETAGLDTHVKEKNNCIMCILLPPPCFKPLAAGKCAVLVSHTCSAANATYDSWCFSKSSFLATASHSL